MNRRSRHSGFSLVEVVVVVAIIGILAAVTVPMVGDLNETAKKEKAHRNAQNIAQVSSALGTLGVAHVMPDSLGGVKATARLLREGVTISDGPLQGSLFIVPSLSNEEIDYAATYLSVVYDLNEIRLEYAGPNDA